jgi:hypothetical protein
VSGYPGDIASLRFLAANTVYQATQALLRGDEATDRGVLDDTVLMLDVIGSYYTEQDPAYATEMSQIRQDRESALSKVPRGLELEPSELERFRWRELRAMFRSLCRQGTFVRLESPEASWDPLPPIANGKRK